MACCTHALEGVDIYVVHHAVSCSVICIALRKHQPATVCEDCQVAVCASCLMLGGCSGTGDVVVGQEHAAATSQGPCCSCATLY